MRLCQAGKPDVLVRRSRVSDSRQVGNLPHARAVEDRGSKMEHRESVRCPELALDATDRQVGNLPHARAVEDRRWRIAKDVDTRRALMKLLAHLGKNPRKMLDCALAGRKPTSRDRLETCPTCAVTGRENI